MYSTYIYISLYYIVLCIIFFYYILLYIILYYFILHYIILYYIILHYIILYYMIWYDIIWCYILLYDIIWYDIILFYMIWYDIIWYYMILYDMILYYIIWYDIILYYSILYYIIYVYICNSVRKWSNGDTIGIITPATSRYVTFSLGCRHGDQVTSTITASRTVSLAKKEAPVATSWCPPAVDLWSPRSISIDISTVNPSYWSYILT